MSENLIGIVVSGTQVQAVHLEIDGSTATPISEFTWTLQAGDVPSAYASMHERITAYCANNNVRRAVIKASAVGKAKPTLSHLKSAELRGVVAAATIAGGASTKLIQKATISRTFGDRRADDYISDDEFWEERLAAPISKGRRECALLALSQLEE